jgi:hypothetical protein
MGRPVVLKIKASAHLSRWTLRKLRFAVGQSTAPTRQVASAIVARYGLRDYLLTHENLRGCELEEKLGRSVGFGIGPISASLSKVLP